MKLKKEQRKKGKKTVDKKKTRKLMQNISNSISFYIFKTKTNAELIIIITKNNSRHLTLITCYKNKTNLVFFYFKL